MTDSITQANKLESSAATFVSWLERRIAAAGAGTHVTELDVAPAGRFWLGRLAPEEAVLELGLGDRGERLDPCATGIRVKPSGDGPWEFTATIRACTWLKGKGNTWGKTSNIEVKLPLRVAPDVGEQVFGKESIESALQAIAPKVGLSAELRAEVDFDQRIGHELSLTLVNTAEGTDDKLVLYECELELDGLATESFILESLPDSFRYDRRVAAYGINCGVERTSNGKFRTVDSISVDRGRPSYWNVEGPQPDLRFSTLSEDPLPPLQELVALFSKWGSVEWNNDSLQARAKEDIWSETMLAQAQAAAKEYEQERDRMIRGTELLRSDPDLHRAFSLMNDAMGHSSAGRYDSWRPFQVGFLLANLASIVDRVQEAKYADIVWFATGGGKTETYLGLLVTAALYDRLRGKRTGMTAWSRFPLRMLSLQQTQRFADVMAGAELARRQSGIEGDPFSCGFFVGSGATPNRISPEPKTGEPDPHDKGMPARYQVLLRCPFCRSEKVEMGFDRRYWRLEHRCLNEACEWPEPGLPFYVVDEEIYRFLPTVVIGTLDKAASISMQASMRGFVGNPHGRCSAPGHGFTYAPRSKRPNGCLVPGCSGSSEPLDMPEHFFAPSFRLQDELHLLKDSLGAVDAHYETLLDHLQLEISGSKPKILASSATLTGYERQSATLYRRSGRVFPALGPTAESGFWTSQTPELARRYVAVAPRGVTLEYASDRIMTELQTAIRHLVEKPKQACAEIGIPVDHASAVVDLYGVDVIYGNTLRDLDAAVRSLETQIPVDGNLYTATLTGRTDFEEVRQTLQRLEAPEEDFQDRLHVIAASAMMSHGVDIDRLNVMVMLGLPLTTSEFIQATARVGRRWPGLVFVLHKIARERDAGVFRSFSQFVHQGDRFVEAVPVTRRSRRVLEQTIAGIALARLLMIHEPSSGTALTTVSRLRQYLNDGGITLETEVASVCSALGFEAEDDDVLRRDVLLWFETFFDNLKDPSGKDITFPNQLSPTGKPMISLRDVEEQAPVIGLVE